MNNRDIVEYALRHTKILKMPRRKLSTFGTTNIEYYMLSRVNDITRVREGRVISHRPTIIKPAEISELFEGFGDSAGEYGEALFEFMGSNPRILSYRFRNNPGSSSESVDPVPDVYNRVRKKIKESGSGLTAILEGIDSAWQV